MAYLDNSSEITIDAVLTKKGREKLASGGTLNITQFALSDDEIDYTLYDPAHPKGSAFYDAAIRAIPVLEASTDETQVMKHRLVTLPKSTRRMPIVSVPGLILTTLKQTDTTPVNIVPQTTDNQNTTYTAILADATAGSFQGSTSTAVPRTLNSKTALVAIGSTFTFLPNSALTSDLSTTLTIIGNQTGASVTFPVFITYVQPT
jgi:hypothetical protein